MVIIENFNVIAAYDVGVFGDLGSVGYAAEGEAC